MECLVSVDDECMCVVIVMYVHNYTYGHDSCSTVSLTLSTENEPSNEQVQWKVFTVPSLTRALYLTYPILDLTIYKSLHSVLFIINSVSTTLMF